MAKIFHFLDGAQFEVPDAACRGCFMNAHDADLPSEIAPIVQNELIIVRQDAEWPIPGFYIVSLRPHVGSIADVDPEVAAALGVCVHFVRKAMRDQLGIGRAQTYHEEKIIGPHYHVWLLPLWQEVMDRHAIQPKIYDLNIRTYIDLFKYDACKDQIAACNRIMRETLAAHPWFVANGFS
jgi:diadenosine tetraphosphate (Ap4A) HIT family hydrolase